MLLELSSGGKFSLQKGTSTSEQIYKLRWNEPVFVNGSFQSSCDCDGGPTWLSSSATLIWQPHTQWWDDGGFVRWNRRQISCLRPKRFDNTINDLAKSAVFPSSGAGSLQHSSCSCSIVKSWEGLQSNSVLSLLFSLLSRYQNPPGEPDTLPCVNCWTTRGHDPGRYFSTTHFSYFKSF